MNDGTPQPIDWDARYAEDGWAFGTEPNDFLREHAHLLPRGRVLCLAEGEGRNAVHLATLGYEVTAVDASGVGLDKARALAAGRGVAIETIVADLATFAIEPGRWQGIVSIFAHVPAQVRTRMHAACVAGLAPGGVFLCEGYTPEQAAHGTGGPTDPSKFFTLDALLHELAGLDWLFARLLERDVIEGRFHHGRSSVVQVAGTKPAS
jgi:SAM-dependent methyltransferase